MGLYISNFQREITGEQLCKNETHIEDSQLYDANSYIIKFYEYNT